MYYLGMESRVDHTNEQVPYIIGQHDVIALLGKVNNLERNVITLVIGENDNYKDILAANYDGSLGSGSGNDIHHQGYDYEVEEINKSTDRTLTKTIYGYDKNTGIYTDSGIPAAQGTFGWGGVNDEFPTENQNQKMYHFYKDGDVFKLCKCGSENGAHTENCRQTSYHEYDTIWRYER